MRDSCDGSVWYLDYIIVSMLVVVLQYSVLGELCKGIWDLFILFVTMTYESPVISKVLFFKKKRVEHRSLHNVFQFKVGHMLAVRPAVS